MRKDKPKKKLLKRQRREEIMRHEKKRDIPLLIDDLEGARGSFEIRIENKVRKR